MRRKLGDKLFTFMRDNKVHLPRWAAKTLYGVFKNHMFFVLIERDLLGIFFPKIGRHEYSDLFKVGDDWYVHKTFVPKPWSVLDTHELLSVQPMSGPVGLTFQMNCVYKPVMHAKEIVCDFTIDPKRRYDIVQMPEIKRVYPELIDADKMDVCPMSDPLEEPSFVRAAKNWPIRNDK